MRLLLLVSPIAAICAPAVADPLMVMLAAEGGMACFSRAYDREHLSRHPGQTIERIVLSLTHDDPSVAGATLRVELSKPDRKLIVVASCWWAEDANRTHAGGPVIATLESAEGVACIEAISSDGGSAEEGPPAEIDIRNPARPVLHLDETVTAWPSYVNRKRADTIELHPEDRVFAVEQTSAAQCAALNEGVPPPW